LYLSRQCSRLEILLASANAPVWGWSCNSSTRSQFGGKQRQQRDQPIPHRPGNQAADEQCDKLLSDIFMTPPNH